MPDLNIDYTDIRDEQQIQRDGSSVTRKRVTFYLGKFGPFVERFDVTGFSMLQVQQRVEALRAEIQGMHSL